MERSIKPALAAICLGSLLAAGCGGKGKNRDADAEDAADVPDGADAIVDADPDVAPDAVPDADPDVPVDGASDGGDEPDVEDDCVTSGVGSPPEADLDACLRVASCIAPPGDGPRSAMEFCYYRHYLEGYPIFGEAMELFGMGMYMTIFAEIDGNVDCIGTATDCDAVFACMSGGSASASCTTPGVDVPIFGRSCSGDVLTLCINTVAGTTDGRTFEHDCTDDGLECVTLGTLGAACMQTDCTTAGDPTCDGRDIDWCIAPGAHVVISCDEWARGSGGRCDDMDPSTTVVEPGCVPRSRGCDSTSDAPYCDGDDLVECDGDFDRWVSFDCTSIGAGWSCNDAADPPDCEPDTSGWTCTLPPEPACDCDDVVICNMFTGADMRLECPDYGYSTCGDVDPSTIEVEVGCID